MAQTAVYVRLSQNRSGDEDKPDRQRKACAGWLASRGISTSIEYLDDDVSAFKGKARPAWLRLWQDVRAGHIDQVVSLHMDRLLRSTRELEALVDLVEETGVKVWTVESGELDLTTSAGRQMARVLVAITTGESERKAERHKSKSAQLREQGRSTGGARPFGWVSPNGDLEPAEAALIFDAIKGVLAGETLYSIKRQWTASGLTTSMGGKWESNKSVARILFRYRNAGLVEHQGEVVGEAVWPAIEKDGVKITREDIDTVRAILSDPERRTTPGPTRKHLLSGILKCGNCGSDMRKAQTVNRSGTVRNFYRCTGPDCYVSISQDEADRYVSGQVVLVFTMTDAKEFAADPADREKLAELYAERASMASESDYLWESVGKGHLSAKSAQIAQNGLTARLQQIDADLAFIASRIATAEMLSEPAYDGETHTVDWDKAVAVKDKWLGLDLEKKRTIITELYSLLAVSPGRGQAEDRINLVRK